MSRDKGKWDIVFACGAAYRGVADNQVPSKRTPDGRVRLSTYDSDPEPGKFRAPRLGRTTSAPCFACPARVRDSGRKSIVAFPRDESKPGRRFLTTCLGTIQNHRGHWAAQRR